MVKNVSGGSKHKNVARKNLGGGGRSHKLRKATEEGELYAVVTKILGGSNCSVVGCDDKERMCVIRGKFRAAGRKRDNTLRMGTLVLVGDRTWETSASRITCDLLEVYTDGDKEQLKDTETSVKWDFLNGVGEINKGKCESVDDGLVFGDNTVKEEYENLIIEQTGEKATTIDFDHEGEVDIDDI